MPTNIKENGFETLIVEYLVSQNGYEEDSNEDYNKTYAIDDLQIQMELKQIICGKKYFQSRYYPIY